MLGLGPIQEAWGNLTMRAMALGSSFLYVFLSSALSCPCLCSSLQGMDAPVLVVLSAWGWLPGLGELGGEVQREELGCGQRAGVWPCLRESYCSVLGTLKSHNMEHMLEDLVSMPCAGAEEPQGPGRDPGYMFSDVDKRTSQRLYMLRSKRLIL